MILNKIYYNIFINMTTKNNKIISDKYQKKSQLEHILDIPDTYIGSIETIDSELYVFDDLKNKIVKKRIEYIPGLERIYEEILLNAFDQTVRENTGTNKIKVKIDKEKNEISIENNGQGVPVILKEEEGVYIPEMIFGMLLTSGNYKKGEKRIVGGKNGYGAKLANIFSTEFTLETIDEERGKKFKLTWKDNMSKKGNVKITDSKSKGMTKITFKPDLKKFNIKELTDDIISVMKKRVYDIAVNTNKSVSVYYNGEKLPIKKFEDYMKLYLKEGDEKTMIVDEDTNGRWSIGLYMSDDNYEQVSFVNGINTNLGGTHVDEVTKLIIKEYSEKLKKKKLKIKNSYIKDKLFIFIKSFIENPSFNSQTKECMSSRPNQFGSKWIMNKKFSNSLNKLGIIEEVTSLAEFKEKKELKKTDGKVKRKLYGIPKLEDANNAGTRKSLKTKLILTEGDSAKAFAMAGLSRIGRDNYGVFPLKGKLLNVKDQSNEKILKNQEITYLKQILGLKQGYKYKSLEETRYGGIIILTDQDVDGSHIKGLVMNLFHTFWPELLKLGFVKSLITPIVKAFKGKDIISFFTLSDYNKWKVNKKGWRVKYYKGLGTSDSKEAKEALENIEEKLVTYRMDKDEDFESLNLGFSKTQSDNRKNWLMKYNKDNIIEQTQKSIPIKDFIDKDLIHFSNYDNHRSIPSIYDGLKPTQRKILYTGLNYLTKNEIKVAQFSGLVGQKTDYHHGEQSIVSTVVGMAQTFVGANNCNLFLPIGQFGTRLLGGKDRSSERYIHTNISNITKMIYNTLDNDLLKYINSDGQMVEPEYYAPCIPMILVNGTLGIGTGFSTEVLPHKIEDIVEHIKLKLDNKNPNKLRPWYRNFKGEIKEVNKSKYITYGKYEKDDNKSTITITELPIGTWTENYKQFIEDSIIDNSKSKKQFIKNYINQCTQSKVTFILELDKTEYKKLFKKQKLDIYKKLKLVTNLSETNMYLFDQNNKIKKFKSPEEIMNYYYDMRLNFYDLRKKNMIEKLTNSIEELKNKVRFIRKVKSKQIEVLNTSDEKLNKDLEKYKFTKLKHNSEFTFDYLINMSIRSLTYENAKKMEDEYKKKVKELETLKLYKIKDMWKDDLEKILLENNKYNIYLQKEIDDEKLKKDEKKKKKKSKK